MKNPAATTSRAKNNLKKEIACAFQLALNQQYKVTKPNHVRPVNARTKVAVVTSVQAAFGAHRKELIFMPWQCRGAAHVAGWSLGWLGLMGAALLPKLEGKGLSQPRRGCKERNAFGVKRRENITLKEGMRIPSPEPACNTHKGFTRAKVLSDTNPFPTLHFCISHFLSADLALTHGPPLPRASEVRPCQYSPCPEVTSITALNAQAQMMQSIPETNRISQVPQTQHPALVETRDLIPSVPQLIGTAWTLPEPSVPSGTI